jgi:hypothetical protein
MARRAIAPVFVVLAMAGCGRDKEATTAAAPREPTTTSIVESPGDASPPPTPHPTTDFSEFERNDNVKDGGLGSVCWARWEVSRHLLLMGSAFDDETAKADAAQEFEAVLPEVVDTLREVEGNLTNPLRGFAERLRGAAEQAARNMAAEQSGATKQQAAHRAFSAEFEDYPGYTEYNESAEGDPDCIRP